jgi:glycosyltransferase involved in cell wall biosynthesis
MLRLLAAALPALLFAKVRPGTIYFNVGHTGLNEPALPRWIAAHQVRAIYMVHDLIPLTHPQYCRAGEGVRHHQRMANMMASASGVIGNSQATLDVLADYAASRSWPMPPSLAAWISGPDAKTAPVEKMLDSPYFVALGTIEGRKNHLLLLDVWRTLISEMGRKAPTLVLIGQRGWESEHVQALLDQPALFSGKVIELNQCSDDDLASWIGGARALLMPSFAEGFGLPIVEALGLGCPVIASDLPVFREIGRSIPTFIGPADPKGWSNQIRDFIGPGPERARQIEEMKGFRAPGWAEHFARVDRWLGTL